ncbi:hypothetical protein GCM10028808_30250 [Spirosoma migulaei]
MKTQLVVQVGKLNGPFRGFRTQHTRFTFLNGVSWLQNEPKYFYHYSNKPRARVVYDGGIYILEVDGITETVQVIQVS